MKFLKGCGIAALVLVVFFACVSVMMDGSDKPETDTAQVTNKPAATKTEGNEKFTPAEVFPPKPPPEVTALELHQAYDDNEIAADAKWKDNQAIVTGKILEIGTGPLGDPYVSLRADNDFNSVMCEFAESDMDQLATLKKGSHAKIQGTVGGALFTGTVVVRKCKIVQ